MAINNAELSFDRSIVNESDGLLSIQSRGYFLALDDAINLQTIISGVGSPDGVVEALATKQYMDSTGPAGAILYIKQVNDIAGDKTLGWILT